MLRCLALLALMAISAGCDDDNRTPVHFTPSSDRLATVGNDTAPDLMPAVPGRRLPPSSPAPAAASASLMFVPQPGSALGGAGEARSRGVGTSIAVTLQQGHIGITYDGVIRRGGCEAAGPAVAWLIPITSDSLGLGAAASDVPIPLDSLLEQRHVVMYGRGGRAETCAPLSAANTLTPGFIANAGRGPADGHWRVNVTGIVSRRM